MTQIQDLTEPSSTQGGLWESTRQPPALPSLPTGQRQAAASLITAVTEIMDVITRKRLPRMESLRVRLQMSNSSREFAALEEALHALHAAASALDVLAARNGPAAAPALDEQSLAYAEAANRLWTSGAAVLQRHTVDTPVARLLWIDLLLEAKALDRRVRQGVRWLADVEHDLHARRGTSTADVAHRALNEMARRSHSLRERLQRVHSLVAHARSVHTECERLVEHRAALCDTLREKVGPGTTRLQEAMRPLVAAAVGGEPLQPKQLVAVVDARHELQVALTQAGAEVIRLQGCEQEVASQLAWLGQKSLTIA
jgi:hypothetical protein